MKDSQHYIDRTFTTPVVIKKIGTTNQWPFVEVVKGDCKFRTYALSHNAITPVKD